MKETKKISAAAVLRAISAGKKGQELMREFGLSKREFRSVVNQLLAERERRARQILADYRSGLTSAELANKHGFSEANFGYVINRLEQLGYFSNENFNSKVGKHFAKSAFVDRRKSPRIHHPVLTTTVCDAAVRGKTGLILDLSESGIGVNGIESQTGEEKALFINVGDFMGDEALTLRCRCRWTSANDKAHKKACAGFEIISISENSRGCLKTIIAAEIALTHVA